MQEKYSLSYRWTGNTRQWEKTQDDISNRCMFSAMKACYTRASDLTEIEGTLKDVCESKETQDWTADIVRAEKEEE